MFVGNDIGGTIAGMTPGHHHGFVQVVASGGGKEGSHLLVVGDDHIEGALPEPGSGRMASGLA